MVFRLTSVELTAAIAVISTLDDKKMYITDFVYLYVDGFLRLYFCLCLCLSKKHKKFSTRLDRVMKRADKKLDLMRNPFYLFFFSQTFEFFVQITTSAQYKLNTTVSR